MGGCHGPSVHENLSPVWATRVVEFPHLPHNLSTPVYVFGSATDADYEYSKYPIFSNTPSIARSLLSWSKLGRTPCPCAPPPRQLTSSRSSSRGCCSIKRGCRPRGALEAEALSSPSGRSRWCDLPVATRPLGPRSPTLLSTFRSCPQGMCLSSNLPDWFTRIIYFVLPSIVMRIIGVVLPLWLLSNVHFTFEIASVLISVEFSG